MLKKFLFVSLGLVGLAGVAGAQSFTLTIDAGYLRNKAGTVNEPVGGLLQLIASPTGTFSSPTAGSFIGGDNVLVTSFAMNYTGGTGEVIQGANNYLFITANYAVVSGEALELRFYPTLTYSGTQNYYTTALVEDRRTARFRSNTTEFPTKDASETAWIVPAAGAAKDITYITALDGGTYPDGANGTGISSFASFTVVPEPSACAVFAVGAAGLMGFRAWRRRGKGLPSAA